VAGAEKSLEKSSFLPLSGTADRPTAHRKLSHVNGLAARSTAAFILPSCHPAILIGRVVFVCWPRQRAERTGTRNANEPSAKLVLAYDREHDFVQPDVLLPLRLTCAQHAVDERGDQLITCHQSGAPACRIRRGQTLSGLSPNVLIECRIAFSISRNLRLRLRRCPAAKPLPRRVGSARPDRPKRHI
jgi:hypothetical protein